MSPTSPRVASLLLAAVLAVGGCRGLAPTLEDPTTAPAPVVLTLHEAPADWRPLDGRRVRISAPLTVVENHRLVRDRTLAASFGPRPFTPTEHALPGNAAIEVAAANARRRLVLALPPAASADASGLGGAPWRTGSTLHAVEGIVAVGEQGATLQLDLAPRARPAARPAVPRVGGDTRIAALNLENLFNGDGRGGGFPTARGARTHADYLRQRARLVAALRALDADVVALMELENDGTGPDSSEAQLVEALDAGTGRWRRVTPPAGADDQAIRVGLLYRADRVTPVGPAARLTGGPFGERSRVPLAQAFRAGGGPAFTVVAVHLKSKGCSEAEAADRDLGDGQACWNATRLASVRALDTWLKKELSGSGDHLAVIVGDFNAYAMEDPIRFLHQAGWQDALAKASAPYSYSYGGAVGRLDHALLSPALAARLAGAAEWHINADEAPNVGYRDAIDQESTPGPWRSSDHDPLLLGLRLRSPAASGL